MQKRFTDIFIERPVFATCISLIILLVGIVSYTHMDLRLYPNVPASEVDITVSYAGAPSDIMEGRVATPIENAVSTVDGIDYITSQSKQGQSIIQIFMQLGFDVDTAMTEIANQVASVQNQLPDDIDPPVITKVDPSAIPLLLLKFSSTTLDPMAQTDYLIRAVQPQIQMVSGVSQAQIMGERQYSMRIWLNPHLMAAHNVTADDINRAINNYNVIAPAGTIKSQLQEINLYSSTDLRTAQQFNDMLLRNDNGHLVRIKNIGKAELAPEDTDFSVKVGGKDSIFVQVSQKSEANPLTIQKGIMQLLANINEHLPEGTTITKFFDSTKFITASLHEVRATTVEACIFVLIVIFLMLGSLRAVLVPLVTIPLSLTGACILMLALGFSVNTLTLLAFVLAIGLVVDDAIVVLENFHRHLEEGLTPKQAALVGAREIAFAVIAMTLTLAAVYAPIGFMGGLTGKLFTEFAFTLAGAVLFSGFIALTLSPMMCSKIYRSGENLHKGLAGFVDKAFDKIRDKYKNAVTTVIKFRYVVVIIALIVYGSCYFLYSGLQHTLAPDEDQGVLIGVVFGPAAANLDYTEQQTAKLAKIYDQLIPEKESYTIVNGFPQGVNSALSFIIFKDWDKRKRTTMQVLNTLLGPMWTIPGIQAFPSNPSMLPGATGYQPVQFVLSTIGSYEDLEKDTKKLMREAQQWGGVVNVTTDLKIDEPQVDINIDRNKAADLNINMADISLSLNTFLSKPTTTYFNMNGRSYEVLPELYRKYRNIPDALNNLNVRINNNGGKLVPLASIANLAEEVIPEQRNHFQQLRSATINASLAPGVSLGTALTYLNKLAKDTLPKAVQVDYAGQSRQFIQEAGTMGPLFLFALLFIYLILAAQFESFRDPLVVMLTVPLAIAGALVGLYLCHGTLNIYTNIGLITLIGLITKNGILIVEFANQQQERGMAFLDAIVEGATTRLRPILMTTFAMILGATPLALASGAGAVSRTQMGFVIVFGMSIGTLFTLFVIPVMYYLLASKIEAKTEEE